MGCSTYALVNMKKDIHRVSLRRPVKYYLVVVVTNIELKGYVRVPCRIFVVAVVMCVHVQVSLNESNTLDIR